MLEVADFICLQSSKLSVIFVVRVTHVVCRTSDFIYTKGRMSASYVWHKIIEARELESGRASKATKIPAFSRILRGLVSLPWFCIIQPIIVTMNHYTILEAVC